MKLIKSISLAVMMAFLFCLPQYSIASINIQDGPKKETANTLSREKLDNIIISRRGGFVMPPPGSFFQSAQETRYCKPGRIQRGCTPVPEGGIPGPVDVPLARGCKPGHRFHPRAGCVAVPEGGMSGPRGGISGQQRSQQIGQEGEALTNDSAKGNKVNSSP